jgi:hypothetical protein
MSEKFVHASGGREAAVTSMDFGAQTDSGALMDFGVPAAGASIAFGRS